MTAQDVQTELQKHASTEDALFLQRFFKTGEGQYGAGDVFIGVRVPQTRAVCKQFRGLPLPEVQKLLDSPVHEHRLAGLVILADGFARAGSSERAALYGFYIKNLSAGRINNWDLVDSSADRIVGAYLLDKPPDILFELARSPQLWERRAAIIASFWYIKQGQAGLTLQLSEVLLHDSEDLIQKAVGWMLREVGKRCDRAVLLHFLDEHAAEMPRTMLRYSIEHLPPEQRRHYLAAASP
jgi:3-methyladenine DNA glycosylase AlkD